MNQQPIGNTRRRPRHRLVPARTALLTLALAVLVGEFAILVGVRGFLPCGIGPCLQYSSPPAQLMGDDGHDWVGFTPEKLSAVRRIVESELGPLDTIPPPELARYLRDWTRSQPTGIGVRIASRDPVEILNEIRDGKKAHCEPLAIVYMAALSSAGMVCREVDLFAEPGQFKGAHTTVEVLIGGEWVIQDPTFNAVPYSPDGRPLGAAAAQEAYSTGVEVTWHQDLTPTEPTVDTYSVAPRELFRFAFFRLRRYPADAPRVSLWVARLWDRLRGRPECILVSREPFPAHEIFTSGLIDRCLALVFILLVATSLGARVRRLSSRQEPLGKAAHPD